MRGSFAAVLLCACALSACQSPTDPDEALVVDDILEMSSAPNPATASAATDGRTYRVVRGNNQPDDILSYDWHAVFTTSLSLNTNATNDDVDVAFRSASPRRPSS